VIDFAHGYAYYGGRYSNSPGIILKVRLSDFTKVAELRLNSDETQLNSAAIAPAAGYAYFGTYTVPGYIVRVRLSDMTRIAALTLPTGESYLTSAVTDLTHGYAYFSTNASPSSIVKIDLGINTAYNSYLPLIAR